MTLTQLPMKVREQKIKIVPISQIFYKKLQHQFEWDIFMEIVHKKLCNQMIFF